ncbi:spindle and kinetochore-associated protein 2 isoform X2 [Amphiprion ocellaris]|uniref:spindle and kinetochore-associated protein 2 isoform X2 n=1 Tax=Amphiprion ocellaris TaxID=80972 RepID=UPI0024118AFE|nr:spindle and kinetochore-associated protein 2 isoform X2 [Amphiprion ocellaris]
METTVEKLEAMFLKSEADLDYIEKWLKLDFMNTAENGCPVEVEALTVSETNSAALLGSAVCHNTSEESSGVAASRKQQSHSCDYEELSVSMLDTVPPSIRSNIELTDLNAFYKQLQEHLNRSNSGSLSLHEMKQLKMKPSDAKLKILQHLSLVELDRKGLLRLVM